MSSFIDALAQSSATSKSATTQKKDNTTLGKEDFLSLLVAQMKYQDPLNPDDPTEFTAQLAQFSQLEQLFNINSGMENLVASNQGTDRLTALTAIGKEVAFSSESFSFSGKPVTLGYQLDDTAAQLSMAVRHNGVTVAVLHGDDLTAGTHYLTWDGLKTNGEQAEAGEYSIVIDAKDQRNQSITASSLVRAMVSGADLEGAAGGTLLTASGDIAFNKVLGVFEASL